jgi:rsbT antagonist protein RsbS
MRTPILHQRNYLIATIQATLSDEELAQLQADLVQQVGESHSKGVIVDVTALDVLDSFAARILRSTAYSLKLRGAETVIVGIQPEVAFAMVQLGLSLDGIETALDLDEGLAELNQSLAKGRGHDRRIR